MPKNATIMQKIGSEGQLLRKFKKIWVFVRLKTLGY